MIKKWVEYIKESLDFEKLSHTEEDVYKYTLELLENEIDNIFVDVHQKFNTSSGDITPDQQSELGKITKSLAKLITYQVCQNIELENLKADKIDLNELSKLDDERDSVQEGDEVIAIYGENHIKNIYKFKLQSPYPEHPNDLFGYQPQTGEGRTSWEKAKWFRIKEADLVVKVDTYNDFVFPEKRL